MNWLAFYDPRIQVAFFETTATGVLASGQGDRTAAVVIPLQVPFTKPPQAVVFLAGFKATNRNHEIYVNVNRLLASNIGWRCHGRLSTT